MLKILCIATVFLKENAHLSLNLLKILENLTVTVQTIVTDLQA